MSNYNIYELIQFAPTFAEFQRLVTAHEQVRALVAYEPPPNSYYDTEPAATETFPPKSPVVIA